MTKATMLCKSSFPANCSSCNSQLPYKEDNDWGKIVVGKVLFWGFLGGASGKESTCQSRRYKRCGFNPWVSKIPRGGRGHPLQYSCLEKPMNRGAWWASVHRV